jgi:hypothetical protein
VGSRLAFFALRDDLLALLEFLYVETGARVFEAYSEFDQPLREFDSVAPVDRAFRLGVDEHGTATAPFLQVWWPEVCRLPSIERITLKPGAVPGHTSRHMLHGWGLAQLMCGGEYSRDEPTITRSTFQHWTEAGARKKGYVDTHPDAPVDWRVLQRLGQRVQRHLRRHLAGGRVRGHGPVLRAAAEKAKAGWKLRESGRSPFTYDFQPDESTP